MYRQDGSVPIHNRQLQGDPTHTLTIRRKFAAEAYKRFRALKVVIRQSIVDNDCFGLDEPQDQSQIQQAASNVGSGPDWESIKGKYNPIPAKRFAFTRSADKIDGFMEWLNEQQQRGILEVSELPQMGQALEKQWQNKYIQSAYQKGILRGRQELENANYPVSTIDEQGGINAVFNQPFHADRVGAIYTRAFQELKGITASMDQQISRTLAEGISEGLNPNQMARNITDRVDKVGITRARTLARTETIRAHHQATIQEYENAGVEGVKVKAEWSTARDSRVCPICAPLEGQEYDLETIRPMIPRHPNCRCVALPLDYTEVEQEIAETESVETKEIDPIKNDPVASRFVDREVAQEYLHKKEEYRQFLDENITDNEIHELQRQFTDNLMGWRSEEVDALQATRKKFRNKFKEDFDSMWQGERAWQAST